MAFEEKMKNATSAEILNYYRNLYYTEPSYTEKGMVAYAINDILPKYAHYEELGSVEELRRKLDMLDNLCTDLLPELERYHKENEKEENSGFIEVCIDIVRRNMNICPHFESCDDGDICHSCGTECPVKNPLACTAKYDGFGNVLCDEESGMDRERLI